jgi:cell division protein FtsW
MAEKGPVKKKNKPRRFYDYSLLFTVIFLTVFGLVMIYSSSSYAAQLKFNNAAFFMMKQAKIALGGFVIMVIISRLDYHWYGKFAVFAYVLSYVLMIAVSLFGIKANGKRRWLGVGSLSFQPTEFVKIALIVMLAVLIVQMGKNINTKNGVILVIVTTIPIAGIVAVNNLSSGIIIMGIAFVMLFIACKKKWPFFVCGLAGFGGLAFAGPLATILQKMNILHDYQLGRILVWLEPEAYPSTGGYQVLQGLYAIGSGGLVGRGLGESIQKMGFVPEAQNDMIFSIICEELGLFGAVSVILIFLFMIYRFMLIADNAPDLFGALLVVGVMGHIAIQVILNIAVVTNTIPNTGITLPFISYGGTSVLFLMIEMGMVLSVSNQIKLEK